MINKTKYPSEFLNAIKELKDEGIIEEVKDKKEVVKFKKEFLKKEFGKKE